MNPLYLLHVCCCIRLVKLTSPNLNYVIITGVIVFCFSGYMFVYPPVSLGALTFFCGVSVGSQGS